MEKFQSSFLFEISSVRLKIAPSVAFNLVIFERFQDLMKRSNFSGSNAVRDVIAGAVAGTVGTVLTFPLDTIKTKMQTEGKGKGILQTARGKQIDEFSFCCLSQEKDFRDLVSWTVSRTEFGSHGNRTAGFSNTLFGTTFFYFKKKTGLRFALMLKTREALSETLHTTKSNYPGWEKGTFVFL